MYSKLSIILLGSMFLVPLDGAVELPSVDDIIEAAYFRDSTQRAAINDLTIAAESYSRKLGGDDKVKEEKKFFKTYYFKDTLFKSEFHEYFKDGEKQSEKDLLKEVDEAKERREKGRSRDASVRPLLPFYPEHRGNYEFNLIGTETKQDRDCYLVEARSLIEDENLLEGYYWIEMENYNLAYTEFHPAKLPGPIKQLDMQMTYAPVSGDYWLMERFYMYGRGKVAIFIKFYFEVEELYSDYRINTGLADDIFKEVDHED